MNNQTPLDAARRGCHGRRRLPNRHPGHGRQPVALGRSAGSIETGQVGEPEQARQGTEGRQGDPEVAVTVQGTVTKGTDDKGRPTYSVTAERQDVGALGGPELVLGRQEPAQRLSSASRSRSREARTKVRPSWMSRPSTARRYARRASRRGPADRGSSGETHPGWKPWMADGKPGKGLGREDAPGQLKDKTSTD